MTRLTLFIFGLLLTAMAVMLSVLRLQPPQSHWIAFQSYRDGNYEIYRMFPDGSHLERVTESGHPEGMPTWSPGDEWIVFSGERGDGQRIYALELDKNEVTPLTKHSRPDTNPRWSPDGKWISSTVF